MKLWDMKDVYLIARQINDVAPQDGQQRADLIVQAAWKAGVDFNALADAANRAMEEHLSRYQKTS